MNRERTPITRTAPIQEQFTAAPLLVHVGIPGARVDFAHSLKCAITHSRRGPLPLLRGPSRGKGENAVALSTILLIVLVLLLIGALPSWPYSRGWGYGPSGGLGLVVVILIILLLMGRI